MKKKLLHSLGPFIGVALFSIALWVLYPEGRSYRRSYPDEADHYINLS